MAEYEATEVMANPDTGQMAVAETKVIQAELDDFAKVVQEKFEEAREYRREHELHWEEGYDAYRGKYPSAI